MADPMRPLLDGGASAVKDHRPGRKASGGTVRASGMPPVAPPAPPALSTPGGTTPRIPPREAGSPAPLTANSLNDAPLMADEVPDGLAVADGAGRGGVFNWSALR